MEKDFSLHIYQDLIEEIKGSGYAFLTLKEYFRQKEGAPQFIILRHDVDRRPHNALRMAMLESSFGIQSTYYFRVSRGKFNRDIVKEIAGLGHEIGYHYEVVDKAHGDMRLAGRIFEMDLRELRMVTEICTACTHGNPLSRWDNRDFWKHFSLSQFDLLGEAYISVHDPDIHYATDTGRGWNRAGYNIKDIFPHSAVGLLPALSTTWQLMDLIRTKKYRKIYLQAHPNRWSWQWLQWYRQMGEDLCINWMKLLLTYYHGRK
jgi:hypothetical protein